MKQLKILNENECNYYIKALSNLQDTFKIKHEYGTKSITPTRHSYNNLLFKPLHKSLTANAISHFGVDLFPMYSYARYYNEHSLLMPHYDREACKYSLTLHVGSNDNNEYYPIWFKINEENISFNLNQGEGVFYDGCEYLHWRNACKHDWYLQVFFHWTDIESKDDLIQFENIKGGRHSLWK